MDLDRSMLAPLPPILALAFIAYAVCGVCRKRPRRARQRVDFRRINRMRTAHSGDANTDDAKQRLATLTEIAQLETSLGITTNPCNDDDSDDDDDTAAQYCAATSSWCCLRVPLPFFERSLVRPLGNTWAGWLMSSVGRFLACSVYVGLFLMITPMIGVVLKVALLRHASSGNASFGQLWREQLALARDRTSLNPVHRNAFDRAVAT